MATVSCEPEQLEARVMATELKHAPGHRDQEGARRNCVGSVRGGQGSCSALGDCGMVRDQLNVL